MGKTAKIAFTVGAVLLLVGFVIFGGVMSIMSWDFSKLSTNKYEENSYVITEEFKSVSVDGEVADIEFIPADDGNYSVKCYEQSNMKHSVSVKDGVLVIETIDTRKWYNYIGINVGTPKITVHIPKGEYGALSVKASTGSVEVARDFVFSSIDISVTTGSVKSYASASGEMKIKTSTGYIRIEDVNVGSLDLSVTTGKVNVKNLTSLGNVSVNVTTGDAELTDVRCKNLSSSGSTGDLELGNVIAEERFSIKRSTGDVEFERCDAGEIKIETSTGDVEGTLLSEKIFIANTDTGDKEIPNTASGGRCEITTDTGDIEIRIAR